MMTVPPGTYPLGPDTGRIRLRTTREGVASRVGHDLLLAVRSWSGELTVDGDPAGMRLDLRLELGSLAALEGTGGVRGLTGEDRAAIFRNALQVLEVARFPVATFTSSGPTDLEAGGLLHGTLHLRGRSCPVRLAVERTAPRSWLGTATLRQSTFGIKPYSALFGALRLSDAVRVEAEVSLPA